MLKLQLPSNPIPDRISIAGGTVNHPPATRRTYAELDGPGCIRHLWICAGLDGGFSRKCLLRIFFDGSKVPHVEAPVGDFFGVMHGQNWYPINTRFLSVQATTYWYQQGVPRPFFKMPSFPELAPGALIDNAAHDLPLPEHGNWWVCGPFRHAEGREFLKALPAETSKIDPRRTFKVPHEKGSAYLEEHARALGRDQARWAKAPSMRGFVDFNHYFRCAARGVTVTYPATAVARSVLRAPRAGRARLLISWDDQALLRVNGSKPVDLGVHSAFRSRRVEVDLRAGDNDIALKLSNTSGITHGGWAFAFRCLTEGGVELRPRASS